MGAHRREIWSLGRAEDGSIVPKQPNFDPRLNTGSELYARFFGLEDIYPDELGRKVRRYGFLASSPYRTDEEEREVYELWNRLKKEEIDPGFAPTTRLGT